MSKLAVLIALLSFVPGSVGPASEQAALACPGPKSVPPPRRALPDDQCPSLAAVDAALSRSDELGEDELQRLRATVQASLERSPEGCAGALGARLANDEVCGAAYDAVAVRIVTSRAVDEAVIAGELLRPSPCQWKLVASLREVSSVSPSVWVAIDTLTRSDDDDVRRSAWMTYGTLGRIAREAGETDLAACGERRLSTALASDRPAGDTRVLLSAAGNAGCSACRASLDVAMAGAVEDRRIAVAADRFLEDRAAVDRMCRALRSDRDASVRGAAAFGLRHRSTFGVERLECLYDASMGDPADEVSRDAVASIEELARQGSEDERTLAVGALVRIVRHASTSSVREQSLGALHGFASDDAIRELDVTGGEGHGTLSSDTVTSGSNR